MQQSLKSGLWTLEDYPYFNILINDACFLFQMSLQSLEGTVAAASFADELNKWHKQLQTIEAVLIIWLKVQQLWVQLEEVRICSLDTFVGILIVE